MGGICADVHSVNSPIAGTTDASAPRGSIGLGVILGASNRSRSCTGALANTPRSPPPPARRVEPALVAPAAVAPVHHGVGPELVVHERRAVLHPLLDIEDRIELLGLDVADLGRIGRR